MALENWNGLGKEAKSAGGSCTPGRRRKVPSLWLVPSWTLLRSERIGGHKRIRQGTPRIEIMATDEKHRLCGNRHSESDSNSRIRRLIEEQLEALCRPS